MEKMVKIILDTHMFLWAISAPEKISKDRRIDIQLLSNTVFLSSISIAELMIKDSIGKIAINFDPVEVAEESGFEFLEFSAHDAVLLKDLPFHHKDPFDRMLIVQSISRNIPIMIDDQKFKNISFV